MSKNKLSKFADMDSYPHVFQPDDLKNNKQSSENGGGHSVSESVLSSVGDQQARFALYGRWAADFFHNSNPIVLELGCGRGEYTVGLARLFPNKNFIGVDIKGARMWTGATQSFNEGLTNVAFLRTRIEFIANYFAPDEVTEIWLTFSDPQMKKPTKRLTSTYFLQRYRLFLQPDAIIHLKTDSNFLYTYTHALVTRNKLHIIYATTDLYDKEHLAPEAGSVPLYQCGLTSADGGPQTRQALREARSFQTYYEQQWLQRGISIKYLAFQLPHDTPLQEPDMEIPLDSYRSYARSKRSSLTHTK